jgi:hypothetical protein
MDRLRIGNTDAYAILTERKSGDVRKANDWIFVNQKHSGNVLIVDSLPAQKLPLENIYTVDNYDELTIPADAIVSASFSKPIGVFGADCGLVGLASREGVVGVIHVGWRGLLTEIIHTTVSAMRLLLATEIFAIIGPCIHSECYEFSPLLAEEISSKIGHNVGSLTKEGKAALDLPLAITKLLEKEGVMVASGPSLCTACDDRWFSHRQRSETLRHGLGVTLLK